MTEGYYYVIDAKDNNAGVNESKFISPRLSPNMSGRCFVASLYRYPGSPRDQLYSCLPLVRFSDIPVSGLCIEYK